MNITQSQRIRLSFFLISGSILAILFFVVSIGYKFAHKQKEYFSFFEGESLSGLEQGSTVKFRGIPIGKVDRITYDPHNLSRVKVFYKIEAEFPLKKDMFAQTGMIGITGLKYVEIMGGTNEAETLPEKNEIPARISLFASLSGKSEVIIAKIELLINQLNMLTNPDSMADMRKILSHVEAITASTKNFVNQLSPQVTSIARSTQTMMERMSLVASDVRSVTKRLNDSIGVGKVMEIVNHIDSSSVAMKNLSQNLDVMLLQSREDFTISLQNLRQTIENANELSRLLLENPSLILKGESQKEREK